MKLIALFILLFSAAFVNGQVPAPGAAQQKMPMYYLDSVKIARLPIFDAAKVDSINIVSEDEPGSNTHGKIFIKTKSPRDFKFLTMADVKAIYKAGDSGPAIYMLDNDLLNDTATFRIDSSYILSVQITRASEISYLKDTSPGLFILKIITRTKENLARQNQIRIRGTELSSR